MARIRSLLPGVARRELARSVEELGRGQRELAEGLKKLRRDAKAAAGRSASEQEHRGQLEGNLAALRESLAGLTKSTAAVGDRVAALDERLRIAEVRTAQLLELQADQAVESPGPGDLERLLDLDRIAAHFRTAVDAAPLRDDPFPHVVVEGLFPDDVYDAVVSHLPPRVFFEEAPVNHQEITLPMLVAPRSSRVVWSAVHAVTSTELVPTLVAKFEPALRRFCAETFPAWNAENAGAMPPFRLKAARVMLRRPGYLIKPHRDPKWGFLSALVYLARPGDIEDYGTELYAVEGDEDAPSGKPYYVDPARCRLVRTVPFRRNTVLVFLNSAGAHSAQIPLEADPRTERYLYTFRFGPDPATARQMLAGLDADERARWDGARLLAGAY
jgi:hypothetical protein